jgi:hypothetical protein
VKLLVMQHIPRIGAKMEQLTMKHARLIKRVRRCCNKGTLLRLANTALIIYRAVTELLTAVVMKISIFWD